MYMSPSPQHITQHRHGLTGDNNPYMGDACSPQPHPPPPSRLQRCAAAHALRLDDLRHRARRCLHLVRVRHSERDAAHLPRGHLARVPDVRVPRALHLVRVTVRG